MCGQQNLQLIQLFFTSYSNGSLLSSPNAISTGSGQASWPTVIAIGDTVLSAWKEKPLPSKVWFRSSFDGGVTWNAPLLTSTLVSVSKDPNLAYAYDSATSTHYVYLAFDGQNAIYIQRSTNFGITWTAPEQISTSGKLSQFAHIECNNNGFVGVSFEQSTGTTIFDNTKKDVGFVYSTSWANSGSFGNDSVAYTYNPLGSAFPAFNKIDENNFYLAWLTKDTVTNKTQVFERRIYFDNSASIDNNEQNLDENITIFPNPTNSFLNIVFKENTVTVNKIIIYDVTGKAIKSADIQNNSKYLQTDVSFLTKGIYLLTLQSDKMKYSKTFIID